MKKSLDVFKWIVCPITQQRHVVVKGCALRGKRRSMASRHIGMLAECASADHRVLRNLNEHEGPLFFRDSGRSRFPSAALSRGFKSRFGALNDHIALVFCERGHVSEHHAASRALGVDAFCDAFKFGAPSFKLQIESCDFSGVSAQPVKLPNNKAVAFPKVFQRLLERRTLQRFTGNLLTKNMLIHYAILAQRIQLQIKALIVRGYARIAYFGDVWFVVHPTPTGELLLQNPSKRAERMLSIFGSCHPLLSGGRDHAQTMQTRPRLTTGAAHDWGSSKKAAALAASFLKPITDLVKQRPRPNTEKDYG